MLAFDLADKYRNPGGGAGRRIRRPDDGAAGILEPSPTPPEKPWAVKGTAETRKNLITSIHLNADELEAHVRKLEAKYRKCGATRCAGRAYRAEDAEVLLVGYGIVSRVLRTAVDLARQDGIRAGLFRPITLWPFPIGRWRKRRSAAQMVLVVELSTGQMVEDVRLALNGAKPVDFYGRVGRQRADGGRGCRNC